MAHGSGGKLSHDLIQDVFLRHLSNPVLDVQDDAAVWTPALLPGTRLALTTDSYVVQPLFFPGGDIGKLAVCGTVNDVAMVGAKPLYLSASFILEEGFELSILESIVQSMKSSAEEAGVEIISGDTKVVAHGEADGLYISTTGVGLLDPELKIGGAEAKPGDMVIISGTIGDHGIAVLEARGELGFQSNLESDIAPLNHLVTAMLSASKNIHVLRDPTRGGVATALNEISRQSGVGIILEEDSLPIQPAVAAACEMLGFDPLYIANEGKLLAIISQEDVENVLAVMRKTRYGENAVVIGVVEDSPHGRLLLRTGLGSTRIVDVLAGEMLPRIC